MTFRLEDVAAGYGRVQVLRGVCLTVRPGEIVAVVGPGGVGKSTLIRAAAGLIPTMAGRIMIGERDLTGASIEAIARAGVAHIPDGRRLFPGLTVRDNLRLGGWRIRNTDLSTPVALFPRLADHLDCAAGALPAGEQQMCAVGRALMGRPTYLLIDELSAGLPPTAVAEVLRRLTDIASTGVGVLLAERDAGAALAVASRSYVLEHGSVAVSGRARALAAHTRGGPAYLGS